MGCPPAKLAPFLLLLGLVPALVSISALAYDENLPGCAVDANPMAEFMWMESLATAVDPRPLPSSQVDIALDEDEPLDERPTGSYDLREPLLSKLRRASRASSAKCRHRAGRNICGVSRAKGLCFRGVKEALLTTGLVKKYLPGMYANQAHTQGILAKEGFVNLLDRGVTAEKAPLGAVLVYAGGPKGYGHIELKLGSHEYCSDFCKAVPGGHALNRKLLGVYVKRTN
jgi:hypothetical protein